MSHNENAAAILGLGGHRPAHVVGNDELSARLDTDDDWIRRRTGIITRRIAADGETVVAMAADASAKAIADAGIDASDVGLVILATCTAPSAIPGGAANVARQIGAASSGAFDLNAACAGFSYGIGIAADIVRRGDARSVVVVGSERLSDVVDWTDRSSAILFGDGAGAAVVGHAGEDGIGPAVWGSDGTQSELICQPPGGRLTLDGPAVFRWTVTALADVAREACERAGVRPADLAGFVPHQANLRIIDALARDLGITGAVARDITGMANTSSASIPLALLDLRDTGAVGRGDRVLLLGFGAGLTWSAQVVTVP